LQTGGDRSLSQEPLSCAFVEPLGLDSFQRDQPAQFLLLGGKDLSQSAPSVVSLRPICRQSVHAIRQLAVGSTLRIRVSRIGEKGRFFDVEYGIDSPQRVDPVSQFLGEVRTFRAKFLRGRMTSMPANLVPLDEQIKQPIFNG
jgi:hypothetical protein